MKRMSEKQKTVLGGVLFACFVCMSLIGYLNGEASLVMNKAVNICLQCIGIG